MSGSKTNFKNFLTNKYGEMELEQNKENGLPEFCVFCGKKPDKKTKVYILIKVYHQFSSKVFYL